MLKTDITELLGIAYPIFQGGMAWVATSELVIAVSEAGALGILGAGNAPTEWVREQLEHVQSGTSKPYGLNVPLFSPYVDEVIALCIEKKVPVLTTGAGNPTPYIESLKGAGITVIPVVSSAALAHRLERAGADAVIAEGQESGGHIGTVGALDIPVIAAGGFGDGRGLAAALSLGASGVQMGTRFICTDECIAHEKYKQAIVRANERSTMVTGASLGHPVRCLRNPMTRSFKALEDKGITGEEIIAFGTGRLRLAAMEGDIVNGSLMAGQISGLVHEILPAAEVVRRTAADAEALLKQMQSLISG